MNTPPHITLTAPSHPHAKELLSTNALNLITDLHRRFNPVRLQLLQQRQDFQQILDDGALPDFLPDTQNVRNDNWSVAPIPNDVMDRRVEITGPPDRKMIINAVNSGARVFMADFEDSLSPTWDNLLTGQHNLTLLHRRNINFTDPKSSKQYSLNPQIASLMVRPRGWHLDEKHLLVDNQPVSGALFDFALYLVHNLKTLQEQNLTPCFYLPKIEHYLEARLWNDVFIHAQKTLGATNGTIRATVLIETLPAAFQMDEILFELKDHILGLNCGRWDYIFSYIKRLRRHPQSLLPDRSQVGMDRAFLNSYAQLLIKTCHRRNAFAMGGMAAQIPVRSDPNADASAKQKVRDDKQREAQNGHDGTWVAHPDLVPVAADVFNKIMPTPHQIHVTRDDLIVSAQDLLKPHSGSITLNGALNNARVGLRYLASWLQGRGAVPINNLMEDAATAEICRAQLQQWTAFNAVADDGSKISQNSVISLCNKAADELKTEIGADAWNNGPFDVAAQLFSQLAAGEQQYEFLTLPAYDALIQNT